MWQYLALLIAVVIGLLILAIIWHVRHLISLREFYSVVPLKRYLMSKEKDNIKPGDILYTRSAISALQEVVVPYIYKHIAIIVKFNNTLYVAETSGKGIIGREGTTLIRRNEGVDIYPLNDRLRSAIGPIFLVKLNKPLTDEKDEALQTTVRYHMGDPYPSLISLYALFILSLPIKTSMYCHTFIRECLINMKLINSGKKTACEIGSFMTSISNYELNDGYKYLSPKQLVYDFECENEIY